MENKYSNQLDENKSERLQKVIAKAGIASRRKAEILILDGSVTVNGQIVTELGTKVNPEKDHIKVNGKLISNQVQSLYVLFYKPKSVISAMSDPEGRDSIGKYLDALPARVNPVGRLDFNSEGLLLLTNDGEIAEKIIKQRGLERTYKLKIKGHPSEADLQFLKKGFYTQEGVVKFSSVELSPTLRSKSWIKLRVIEGSKFDLRDLMNKKGLLVDKIVRESIGHLNLTGMQPGEYQMLKKEDFEKLFSYQEEARDRRFTKNEVEIKTRKPRSSHFGLRPGKRFQNQPKAESLSPEKQRPLRAKPSKSAIKIKVSAKPKLKAKEDIRSDFKPKSTKTSKITKKWY